MLTKDIMRILSTNSQLSSSEIHEQVGPGVDYQILHSTLTRMKARGVIVQDSIKKTYSLSCSPENAPIQQDGKALELLKFMNSFFNKFADKITLDNEIMNFIVENQIVFTEVDKKCQH